MPAPNVNVGKLDAMVDSLVDSVLGVGLPNRVIMTSIDNG
jgi:hypothetical protein